MALRRSSLWPREHGAYVQLVAPLVAAVAIAPSWAGLAISVAAFTSFLAFEPARVLVGLRGVGRRQRDAARATRRLVLLVTVAAATTVVGVVRAPPVVASMGWVAVPVALALALAMRRQLQSVLGEVVVAVALSGAAVPVAIAGGLTFADAAAPWVAWSAAYASTVVAVHHVLDQRRAVAHVVARWLGIGAIGVACVALVPVTRVGLASLPLVLTALGVVAWSPAANRVRVAGIAFLFASLATMGALIAVLRVPP